jgi:anti-anti-sigma factor
MMSPPFSVNVLTVDEGRRRIVVAGELDLATAPELESTLSGLCTDGATEIEIDLRGVSFVDSTGIRALLVAKDECDSRQVGLSMIATEAAQVRKLWEVTKLTYEFPWRDAPGEQTGADDRIDQLEDGRASQDGVNPGARG